MPNQEAMLNFTAKRVLRVGKRVARRAFMRSAHPHGLILMYHRVAAPSWDPWNLSVSPERFEQQLTALSRAADIVPLSQLYSRLRAGRRGRPVVALTFDDGYADNLHAALPLLERYSAPATVFVVSGLIGQDEPFWWDRLSEVVRSIKRMPPKVVLQVDDEEFTWKPERDNTGENRDELNRSVRSRLLVATDEGRRMALEQLMTYADKDPGVDPGSRPMTRDELRRLASSPLVEIGSHTKSHPSLPDLPKEAQFDEIAGSRQQCQEITGQFPSSFAYPYGGLDAGTPELVRSAGFERACSCENDLVWEGSETMLLPRIMVTNYTTAEFCMRLHMEWLP